MNEILNSALLGGLLLSLTACAIASEHAVGLTSDAKLAACPSSPNCVSSDATDDSHGIAPLAIDGEPEVAWNALVAYLEKQPRFTILVNESGYLHAESRTRLLRFVDDVEFHLRPDEAIIAMRSASRLGYSDFGTNRRRLEAVRVALRLSGDGG